MRCFLKQPFEALLGHQGRSPLLSSASLSWRLPFVCKPNAPPHVWHRLCVASQRSGDGGADGIAAEGDADEGARGRSRQRHMMRMPAAWLYPDRADQRDFPNYDDRLIATHGDQPRPLSSRHGTVLLEALERRQ